jgi:hypothetical protein
MQTLVDALRQLVHLVGDTFRLWWKNVLPMTTWWLGGFLGFTVCVQAAIWLAAHAHSSLGTGIFAIGVLLQITAAVGMIRTCAMSLYRWRDAASSDSEETSDPTQQGLLELLAVTLLPLVAVWSAWGFFDKQVNTLTATFLVQNGMQPGSQFFKLGITAWHKYLPVLLVLLVLRRVFQAVDDRWPSRPVKFAQVWAEAFFVLITFVITPFAILEGKEWFKLRSFWYWSLDWWDGVKDFFAGIHIPVPAGIEFLWGFLWDTLWPLFKDGVAEPLTWLAITTVVFGHRVLSSGGVFRGTRLERRLGGRAEEPQRSRFVQLTYKAPDLVLAGVREKFYPALNAFRLLVRVGPVFLGVVCLVYTAWFLAVDWFFILLQRTIGIHGGYWGLMNIEIAGTVERMLFEPLRIALLAAAFDLCISVGIQRRNEAAAAQQAEQRAAQQAGQEQPVPATA